MNHQFAIAATSLASSSGLTEASGATLGPASPAAVSRFNELMYQPAGRTPSVFQPAAASGSGIQSYALQLSQRWEAGQAALKGILDRKELSVADLARMQMHVVSCAVDVEVSSKCASILESGVQTLVQRGGA